MELTGAVAIVTGGSRGIGKAIVDALVARGATVEICSLSGAGVAVDVRSREQVQVFVQDVWKRHGRIDILVNNAGAAHPLLPIEEIDESDFEACFDTNVKGVFHLVQAVLPHMKQQGSGAILNVGSRAGTRAHPGLSVYSASKFALRGLTQALAKELRESVPAIRCYVIAPGGVDTTMRAELFGAEDSARQQSPQAIAEIVVGVLDESILAQAGAVISVVGGKVADIEELP